MENLKGLKYPELMAKVKENTDKSAAFFEKMDADIEDGKRKSLELTQEEREQLIAWGKEADEAEARAVQMKDGENMRAEITQRQERLRHVDRKFGGRGDDRSAIERDFEAQKRELRSVGHQFTDDEQFKAWLKGISRSGSIPQGVPIGVSPAVEVKTLITGASSTSAGAFITTDRKPIVDMGVSYRPLTLFDLITMGQTESDTVDYVREGSHTNSAAPIAEATATGDGSGASPESAMVLSIVTENVKTISHWIPATRNALADASQIRTLIDAWLRYGLMEELEDQMLVGSGSGQNFTGFHNTSGLTSQAYDTDLLTTTRKARTKVRVTGRATPTAYLMHPNDWEDFDLLQDNEARYMFGGPTQLGSPRLWGLPVVENEAETEGQAACTDWRMAILWDRMQTAIYVSDSHSDFFVRRMVAILAEMRAAFTFRRPAAFVEIDLTA